MDKEAHTSGREGSGKELGMIWRGKLGRIRVKGICTRVPREEGAYGWARTCRGGAHG
jgi:hypothetical protein